MPKDLQETIFNGNWLQEVETAVKEGLFQNKYKILVLVTADTTGRNTDIVSKCAGIFHRYGLVEETDCEYYWLLNILSEKKDSSVVRQLADAVQRSRKLQVITDVHQYFFNMEKSASLVRNLASELLDRKTEVPLVFLVRAQALQWVSQTIGTGNVLYLTDGSSTDYYEDPGGENFESVGEPFPKGEEADPISDPLEKLQIIPGDRKESKGAYPRGTAVREWYKKDPDLVRFETARIRKTCSEYTDGEMHFLKDRRCAYWLFTYQLGGQQCRILILYHHDFPYADPENILIIPMAPQFNEFRRLHGDAIDYTFSKEIGREVVAIRTKSREVPDGHGFAETAWKKYFSALSYNGNTRNKEYGRGIPLYEKLTFPW